MNRLAEQLETAARLREVDGFEMLAGDGAHVWGVAGDRTFEHAEAQAFVTGLIAARGGAHLRAAGEGHDAGAFVKATRGEVLPDFEPAPDDADQAAKERATCSRCLARTYRGEECVCDDEGDAEDYDEALADERGKA